MKKILAALIGLTMAAGCAASIEQPSMADRAIVKMLTIKVALAYNYGTENSLGIRRELEDTCMMGRNLAHDGFEKVFLVNIVDQIPNDRLGNAMGDLLMSCYNSVIK